MKNQILKRNTKPTKSNQPKSTSSFKKYYYFLILFLVFLNKLDDDDFRRDKACLMVRAPNTNITPKKYPSMKN